MNITKEQPRPPKLATFGRIATIATATTEETRKSDRKRASKACKNCNLKKIKCQFNASESGASSMDEVGKEGLKKCKSCKDGGLDCEFIERKKRGLSVMCLSVYVCLWLSVWSRSRSIHLSIQTLTNL